jgi:hypothetical protein
MKPITNQKTKRSGVLAARLVAALIITTSTSSFVRAQEKHPFAGVWNANLEKSQRHENHQFKSAKLQFEVSGDVVMLTYSGINMSGKQEASTRKIQPDGKERPIAEAPDMVEIAKWVGSNRLEIVAKKDGKVAGQSSYEVSSDGKTLTATVKGMDAKGRPFEQVIVFDRE